MTLIARPRSGSTNSSPASLPLVARGRGRMTDPAAALQTMVEVAHPSDNAAPKANRHRQMARAALRVALRHGIPDSEIMAEYENVQEIERDAR